MSLRGNLRLRAGTVGHRRAYRNVLAGVRYPSTFPMPIREMRAVVHAELITRGHKRPWRIKVYLLTIIYAFTMQDAYEISYKFGWSAGRSEQMPDATPVQQHCRAVGQ